LSKAKDKKKDSKLLQEIEKKLKEFTYEDPMTKKSLWACRSLDSSVPVDEVPEEIAKNVYSVF